MASSSSQEVLGLIGSAPTVQELSKQPLIHQIPKCFIIEEEDGQLVPQITPDHHGGTNSFPTVPVIDLELLNIAGDQSNEVELHKLHSACKEWGIFQLVNHGVSSSLVEKLKHEIVEFYKLPLEERARYKRRPGDFEGYGPTIIYSEDQKMDWGDRFYIITNPVHTRKPHLLPDLPLSLRDTLENYLLELQKVAMGLIGLMAKALKVGKEDQMEEMLEDGLQSVRMTYYPQCPQPELVMGLTPHSDATAITILLQVNGVEGLQVKKDGVWIPLNFLPHAFVVNVGDILEVLSNGIYKSIEHRATVNSVKERISIAMFFNPKLEVEIGPFTSLINPKNPPLFKRVGMEKYVRDFFSRKLDGKSFLDLLKIKEDDN